MVSKQSEYFFSMAPHSMLWFSNVFRISEANRKVGKNNSMLILQNNTHEITQNFRNSPRFWSLPIIPYDILTISTLPLLYFYLIIFITFRCIIINYLRILRTTQNKFLSVVRNIIYINLNLFLLLHIIELLKFIATTW